MEDLIDVLCDEFGDNIYRKINVFRDKNGKKQPRDEHNDWSQEQIAENRGKGNAFSIYPRHCVNDNGRLVVVDFDDANYKNNPLYISLINDGCIETKSKKGAHIYIQVKDMPSFSNETDVQNMYETDYQHATDLITDKKNIWECHYEDHWDINMGTQTLNRYNWSDISDYFDSDKLNKGKKKQPRAIRNSQSDSDLVSRQVMTCPENQFKSYLERLKVHRWSYDNWIAVGIMCYNNFNGSDVGFKLWLEFTMRDPQLEKRDSDRSASAVFTKYNTFGGDREVVCDFRKLKSWADKDTPINPYEEIYKNGGRDAIVEELNTGEKVGNRCGYNISTSEFIIETPSGWYLKSDRQADLHFECYTFTYTPEDDPEKTFSIKPFKLWRSDMRRNQWGGIIYDPTGAETGNYNLWKGFKITPQACRDYSENDAKPLLDHIWDIWAQRDEDHYNYILDWFAHKIQRPSKKMAVTLCLNSGEGAGKNVVLNKFFDIMGNNYDSVANANNILGDFNATLEGKVLLNFDEITYGGDHKTNNRLKALISEDYVHINKKHKEVYKMRSLADFIFTTNEDYFIGVTGDSRRYCPLSLSDKWVGIQTDECFDYFKRIRDTPAEAFAKVLYERDISRFNPRKFKKTPLFQRQVEKSWTSDIRWLYQALFSGHIANYGGSKTLLWGKLPPKEETDFHYEAYGSSNETDVDKIGFMSEDKRWYRLDPLYKVYSQTKMGSYSKIVTPQDYLETLRKVFPTMDEKHHSKLGACLCLPSLENARRQFNVWSRWTYNWGNSFHCEQDIAYTEDYTLTAEEKENEEKYLEEHFSD